MWQPNTILKQLKTDMKNKINRSNGYNTNISEIRRGIHLFDDFSLKPAVSFWNYKVEKEEEFGGGGGVRCLYIYLYGYTDSDGLGNVDSIHELAEDVENFLYSSDWTYTNDTWLNDFTIYEGGTQDPSCIFETELKIKYIYN